MMRKPAHSRFGSSSAPSPRRSELPGAENSSSVNTSPTVEKAVMLKSPLTTNEVNVVLPHISMKALKKIS